MIPRQSVADFGNLLRTLFSKIQNEQSQQEAAKQAQGFFTQPTTPTDIPSGIGGITYPNIQVPTGTPQPNISAMLSALFSANPYSQQNAKTALGASDMFMPKRQLVDKGDLGIGVVTTPPFGGEPTYNQLQAPRFKPTLPLGFSDLTPVKKAEESNRVLGTNYTEKDFTPQQTPTELAKYQSELAQIKTANPKDPRIPQYEATIKRLQVGVPYFQAQPSVTGENLIFNPKTGKYEGGSGTYRPVPEETKKTYGALLNNLNTIKDIREIKDRASVTGAVSGRARKLGVMWFSDKDAQKLINTVGQLRTIIYGMSGKQINEQEYEWLNKEILPKIAQPDENFEVTLDILEKWLNDQSGMMEKLTPSLKKLGGGRGKEVDDPLGIRGK